MNLYRSSTDSLYEIPRQPSRQKLISVEEITTKEAFNKLASVKKSNMEYARPFFEHMKEYINDAKAKGMTGKKWKPVTVGQPNETI